MNAHDRIDAALRAGDYDSVVAAVPYAAYLGLTIESDADRARRYRMPYRDDLIGNVRIQALHGGAIAAFLECAAVLEVLITQHQRRIPRVIDFAVDYLRSARPEDSFAGCRVLRHGSRVAQVQAEAWQSERGRPVAFVRADFLLQDG